MSMTQNVAYRTNLNYNLVDNQAYNKRPSGENTHADSSMESRFRHQAKVVVHETTTGEDQVMYEEVDEAIGHSYEEILEERQRRIRQEEKLSGIGDSGTYFQVDNDRNWDYEEACESVTNNEGPDTARRSLGSEYCNEHVYDKVDCIASLDCGNTDDAGRMAPQDKVDCIASLDCGNTDDAGRMAPQDIYNKDYIVPIISA